MKTQTKKTYDVIFNDEVDSNSQGFKESISYCERYIRLNAGTDCSYFADYKKNATCSIVCNETGDIIRVYNCANGRLLDNGKRN